MAHCDEHRLPTDLKPTHYDLVVQTDIEKLAFKGYVIIHLDVTADTSAIVFNVSRLEISAIEVRVASEVPDSKQVITQDLGALSVDKEDERATINLPTTVVAGRKIELKINFSAELGTSAKGYFRSSWEDDGTQRFYSVTQFAPISARAAFPCWDEPLLKATVYVTMVSREALVNLSNMPVLSEDVYTPNLVDDADLSVWLNEQLPAAQESGSWKVTRFEKTPPMSVYTLAWASGPFQHIEDSYESPLSGKVRPLRIYATKDLIAQAQFVLQTKKAVLPLYERAFDIEFPLPKLDTLVIHDYESGAMENWGLIVGKTDVFLLDPKRADILQQKRVALVESHETAHMWFGNITTMAWWDGLYLNEGFASLMGEVIIPVFPEWKVHSAFISNALAAALSLDAKLSAHAIQVPCMTDHMIDQIFDQLSYSKAAAVLRMLSEYVGQDNFLKGVSIYLKKHLYANSVTEDLWEGVQEATGIDVPKMMDNWIKKMGYPIVTVTEQEDGIRVRQDRFLESGPAPPEHNETIWTIPLALVSADASGKRTIDRSIVLDERERFIPLDCSRPFKLNAGTIGVYRVLYTPDRVREIAIEMAKEDSLFSVEDRIGFVHDALALTKSGYMDISSALTLFDTFHDEKQYLVWASIADTLNIIRTTWFEHEKIVAQLDVFTKMLFSPIVERLGYEYPEGESVDTSQLRTTAIVQAATAGDITVVNELKARFWRAIDKGDNAAIPPDLTRITYKIAVAHGDRREYDAVMKLVASPPDQSVKMAAMRAIGAVQDSALAEETWDYIMNKARVLELLHLFLGLQQNPFTRHFVVEKFKQNFDVLYDRLKDTFSLRYWIEGVLGVLVTAKDAKETEAFFKGKDTTRIIMVLRQSVDGIRARADWVERSTEQLRKWLSERA